MGFDYSLSDLLFYLVLYSFAGWAIEVCLVALRDRRFVNRGFLNLPFKPSSGVTVVILLETLPTLGRNIALQYLLCIVVVEVVRRFSDLFAKGIGSLLPREGPPARRQEALRLLWHLIAAGSYLILYLIVHPVVFTVMTLVPDVLICIVSVALGLLILADYVCVCCALHTVSRRRLADGTRELANSVTNAIWRRLEKAYPGIAEPKDLIDGPYTFAKGLCFDKLVWVFLISACLGALIEMAYCYATGGGLINRSSVIYGPFSFVWGFGAVVLTVSLRPLVGKAGWHVFLAGFAVGGAYEYFCSVFTELVFGTVFWDYSHMPLNIGGRTNVVYGIFWGVLALVWVKALYPLMERGIEKIPPLAGKILTWTILVVMVCNGLLTAGAMIRYTERQTGAVSPGAIRRMLDAHYDDAWMENRWPYMVITHPAG